MQPKNSKRCEFFFCFVLLGVTDLCECKNNSSFKQPIQHTTQLQRSFNLDLCHKLVLAKCDLVDAMVTSGVSRYMDFKDVKHVYVFREGKFARVPCSKGDVFQSKELSLFQKRALMKFLKNCLDEDGVDEATLNC